MRRFLSMSVRGRHSRCLCGPGDGLGACKQRSSLCQSAASLAGNFLLWTHIRSPKLITKLAACRAASSSQVESICLLLQAIRGLL